MDTVAESVTVSVMVSVMESVTDTHYPLPIINLNLNHKDLPVTATGRDRAYATRRPDGIAS